MLVVCYFYGIQMIQQRNYAKKRWCERSAPADVIQSLMRDHDLSNILARILAGRGVHEPDAVQNYLRPRLSNLREPSTLAGVPDAVCRLEAALRNHEKIGIFGDYDVDGVTSTALLWDFLEESGGRVEATIPDRLLEGYGLSRQGVDRLHGAGVQVLVTVDCGITAHQEVAYAAEKGIDVIVIDHHTVLTQLPRAVAVINPHRTDCSSGATHLCAVGVTFYLCAALRRSLRQSEYYGDVQKEPILQDSLDLVALGTVADVVPLVRDNRIFVSSGLKVMAKQKRPGLRALMDVARIDLSRLGAGHLGFQLGPRINAAGRLGDAMKAVELLRTASPQHAKQLAKNLDEENLSRRELERRILEEALQTFENYPQSTDRRIAVVGNEEWHPGVVGIVASRMVDHLGMPAIVVGQGGKGSGRSIPAFHLYEALQMASGTLAGFGGHAHAAGVQLPAEGLEPFRLAMEKNAQERLTQDDLGQRFFHDGELALEHVNLTLCDELKMAGPYGRNNPEPTFRFNRVRPHGVRTLTGGHFKAFIGSDPKIEVIVFGQGERIDDFSGEIDLLGIPEKNEWRGTERVQIRVKDFGASRAE